MGRSIGIFAAWGGEWVWGDVMGENLHEMSTFLSEPVTRVPESDAPFQDGAFDCIVAIDVLEHLPDDQPFLLEMRRVLHKEGTLIVTVPNGDPTLLANRIKSAVGMKPEVYGHTRAGYTVPELSLSIREANFVPTSTGGYSRLFTEMMELIINFGYVFVLSRKKGERSDGEIAPTSAGQMKTHGAAFKLYSALFPLMRLISKPRSLLVRPQQ